MLHDARDLVATQDDRYANRHARAWHVLNRPDLDVEDVAIQEQKRAERKAAISEAPISDGCRFR
jgi:hypothetical protein